MQERTSSDSPSSLQRGLAVLTWVARQQRPCGVREIAAASGINKTSVHRFLDALRREGWVTQNPATGKYSIGPVPVEIGLATLATMEFRAAARPLLQSMAHRTGETSYLGVLFGAEVVYVDVVLGRHPIIVNRSVGARFPAHRTAIGKILLADLPVDQLDRVLAGTGPFPSGGDDWGVGDLVRLRSELAQVRQTGLAFNDEESSPGVYSLAAPIRDFSNTVVAGMGLGGPKERILPRLRSYSELVRGVAEEASRTLGCRGDPRADGIVG